MPFRSPKQRKAMYAAAEGHSTLGISKSGAKKFIAHSKDKPVKKKKGKK